MVDRAAWGKVRLKATSERAFFSYGGNFYRLSAISGIICNTSRNQGENGATGFRVKGPDLATSQYYLDLLL